MTKPRPGRPPHLTTMLPPAKNAEIVRLGVAIVHRAMEAMAYQLARDNNVTGPVSVEIPDHNIPAIVRECWPTIVSQAGILNMLRHPNPDALAKRRHQLQAVYSPALTEKLLTRELQGLYLEKFERIYGPKALAKLLKMQPEEIESTYHENLAQRVGEFRRHQAASALDPEPDSSGLTELERVKADKRDRDKDLRKLIVEAVIEIKSLRQDSHVSDLLTDSNERALVELSHLVCPNTEHDHSQDRIKEQRDEDRSAIAKASRQLSRSRRADD